jgi:hypothetical protein
LTLLYGGRVRLTALLLGLVAGSAMVTMGVLGDALMLVATGLLLAVPAGMALKPELDREPYSTGIRRGRRHLLAFAGYLRRRKHVTVAGAVAGLLVGGLAHWDFDAPLACLGLYISIPQCDALFAARPWIVPTFGIAGLMIGWFAHDPSKPAVKTNSRLIFEVLGQLVALFALTHGAKTVALVASNFPGYRQTWLGLTVSFGVMGGLVLYMMGLRRWTGPRAVRARTAGWVLLTGTLVVPLWLEGLVVSALAAPVIPDWGTRPLASSQPVSIPAD